MISRIKFMFQSINFMRFGIILMIDLNGGGSGSVFYVCNLAFRLRSMLVSGARVQSIKPWRSACMARKSAEGLNLSGIFICCKLKRNNDVVINVSRLCACNDFDTLTV